MLCLLHATGCYLLSSVSASVTKWLHYLTSACLICGHCEVLILTGVHNRRLVMFSHYDIGTLFCLTTTECNPIALTNDCTDEYVRRDEGNGCESRGVGYLPFLAVAFL